MVQENVTNFATSTLATPTLLAATGLTFTVAAGTGAVFPSSLFFVTIDTEILFITSRTADTFTMSGLASCRGQDNTTASTHSAGATVQHAIIASNINHIWNNLADIYTPEVPPIQISYTPSPYDNEFETLGSSWVMYPNSGLPAGTSFDVGLSMRSHLAFNRGFNDNGLYTAYVPFAPGSTTPYTITTKISDAVNIANNGSQAGEVHLFVSDQSNPSSSADSGNRFRVDIRNLATVNNGYYQGGNHYVRTYTDAAGTGKQVGPAFPLTASGPTWLRIASNGNGGMTSYVSTDGLTYYTLASFSQTITPQSLGMTFYAATIGGGIVTHTVACDYVRVGLGFAAAPFGGFGM